MKNIINNKNILVTGATGSFGQYFINYILENFKPKRVVIYSRDELKQYQMNQKFKKYSKFLRYFIGDVRDLSRLNDAFRNIDLVIHAAALKQVPAMEYNPMECIKTNIMGAQNIISASISNKVKKVIALSTDKAANPINLYGATKLVSDKLFVAANNMSARNTIFSVVRYGNVIGSRGSILPLLLEYKRDEVDYFPITSKEMTRFFISLNEGVKFVISSLKRMHGGEIFIPKIPSIKIIDLAKAVDSKKPIKIIGIRPGEKLHEVMCAKDDSHLTLEFKDHYVIKPSIDFYSHVRDLSKNMSGEKGKHVKSGFEYNSNTNPNFMNINEIKKIIKNFNGNSEI